MRERISTDEALETRSVLVTTPVVQLAWVTCHRAGRGLSCEEVKPEHEIAIPLRGANMRHVESRTYTSCPSQVMLSNRGEPYRVSHPYGSGESALQIVVRDDVLVELVATCDRDAVERPDRPFRARQIRPVLGMHLEAQLFMARAQSRTALQLEEEVIAWLLRMLASVSEAPSASLASPRDFELVAQARAFLAAHYQRALRLDDVAQEVGISVYHLCRVFRRVTGGTLWAEVQTLRSHAALQHLAEDARDLTALALSLGYSQHSHFTASFRDELGMTPSAARALLRQAPRRQRQRLAGAR